MRKREEQHFRQRRKHEGTSKWRGSAWGEVGNGKSCLDLALSSVLCRANMFRQVSDRLTGDRSREQTEGKASPERGEDSHEHGLLHCLADGGHGTSSKAISEGDSMAW